ncbi:hypothetical protein LCGC14_1471820, partial [marine sediment metagenome]
TSGAHDNHYLYFTGKWDSVSGTSVDCTSSNDSPQYWALVSYGPDRDKDIEDIDGYDSARDAVIAGTNRYDSDSGITSSGDIVIIGP